IFSAGCGHPAVGRALLSLQAEPSSSCRFITGIGSTDVQQSSNSERSEQPQFCTYNKVRSMFGC
uniref:Uncharacterized protein n=1 Tax=Triticum urartu TaxID=4572 RepID=A0A8R7THC8_TRIUA